MTRRLDGPSIAPIAETGSLTLVPAGTAHRWVTQEPIAFAHLYIRPRQLEETVLIRLSHPHATGSIWSVCMHVGRSIGFVRMVRVAAEQRAGRGGGCFCWPITAAKTSAGD